MKIKCEKCNFSIDIEESYGLCPKCNYYNSPPNSTPDLDFVDTNVVELGEKTQTSFEKTFGVFKIIFMANVLLIIMGVIMSLLNNININSSSINNQYNPPDAPLVSSTNDISQANIIDTTESTALFLGVDKEELSSFNVYPINLLIIDNVVVGYDNIDNDFCNYAVIPEGVVEISDYAFAGCDDLEVLILSSTVERIGEGAFAELTNLYNLYLFSERLTVIDDYAFFNVSPIEVYVPKSVKYIGDYAMNKMNIGFTLSDDVYLGEFAINR